MTVPARDIRRITVRKFLEMDEEELLRYAGVRPGQPKPFNPRFELIRGAVVMMAPASPRHALLVGHLTALLWHDLSRESGLFVYGAGGISDEMWVYQYLEADVIVGARNVNDLDAYLETPFLIAEILAPSTERRDRMVKRPDYQT